MSGVRSTWLIVAVAVLLELAVSAMTTRHLLGVTHQPVRVLTAAVPLLPLPIAAMAAGAVGALSFGEELRYSVLTPHAVTRLRRLRLLLAKLFMVALVALLLSAVSVAGGLLMLRYGHPGDGALRHQLTRPAALRALAGYAGLAVAGGWTGLLAAVVLRGAAAGMLAVLLVPVAAQPLVRYAAHVLAHGHTLSALGVHLHGRHTLALLLPVGHGREWAYAPLSGVHGPGTWAASYGLLVAAAAFPVGLLLLVHLVQLVRRRGL